MKLPRLRPNKLTFGATGEAVACRYLRRQGFTILRKNFRIRYGEIDIIALEGDVLVFVEVKTRSSDRFGIPEEAVGPKKLREIIKTADVYILREKLHDKPIRIDVIAVTITDKGGAPYIRHHRNVTG